MGLITGALQIGRSALLAYQSALQVVGNNVSNAGSASYTRQTPVLSPAGGISLPEGYTPGGGVTLSALKRNVDGTLENRIRYSLGEQNSALTRQQALGRIESILNELSDTDLSSLLQGFFNAFSTLQNRPHDPGTRGIVLTAGESLVREIKRQRSDTLALRDELNQDLEGTAREAAGYARDIAELNAQITEAESANPGGSSALRDQRDDLLRKLSELVQIEVREQPNGGVNVYVGNEPLIQDGVNRGLTTTLDHVNGEPRTVVRFADNNGTVELRSGRMAGIVETRDTQVMGHVDALNGLAAVLISEVNKVHSQGQGLEGFRDVTGSYDVMSATAALNTAAAGLGLTPGNGSFQITVRNLATGALTTATIPVDLDGLGADDSLSSLVAQINARATNLTAVATSDNRLRLTAADGFEIRFGQDSSNVLAALGVNTFFTGIDAQDIAVDTTLTANAGLLAAGRSATAGDGSNAAALAELATRRLDGLRGQSLTDYYNTIVANVAVRGAAAKAGVEAADAISASLNAQRESVSGVSLDEETISMLRLERAFQGAARYSSTVDQLIQEMLRLVG